MSYPATVFRILIASPSDVTQERDIAVRTIQDWNDLHSASRQVALLPLRWETHSAPEYGRRPQEVINRQVVDHCDLLLALLWTRIGSPSGISDSGTLEEIERVAGQAKPVMLYFSEAKQNPYDIDLDQLRKVREFKGKTFPTALVETYSTPEEFRDKFARQLEIQIRALIADEANEERGYLTSKPITEIQVHFADPETAADIGTEVELEIAAVNVNDLDAIPDYQPPAREGKALDKGEDASYLWAGTVTNKDYYRELVSYVAEQSMFKRFRLSFKNVGRIGARDVYAEFLVTSQNPNLILKHESQMSKPPKDSGGFFYMPLYDGHPQDETTKIRRQGNDWATNIEIGALQPQRVTCPAPQWFIGADESCSVKIQITIYADTLPEPVSQSLSVSLKVNQRSIPARELLAGMIQAVKSRQSGGSKESSKSDHHL